MKSALWKWRTADILWHILSCIDFNVAAKHFGPYVCWILDRLFCMRIRATLFNNKHRYIKVTTRTSHIHICTKWTPLGKHSAIIYLLPHFFVFLIIAFTCNGKIFMKFYCVAKWTFFIVQLAPRNFIISW